MATFGALFEILSVERPVRTLCRPDSPFSAFVEVIRALSTGSELTLFDSALGPNGIAQLGYQEAAINRPTGPAGKGPTGFEQLRRLVGPDCRARFHLFTSGSTGLPKRVSHSLETLGRGVKVSARHAGDVWALAFNPTHIAGLQVFLQTIANANTLVDVTRANREVTLTALRTHAVTRIAATPSFYRLLLPIEEPLPLVRSVTLGGEPADAALLRRLAVPFPNARRHNIYALTEAGTLLDTDGELFSIPSSLAGRIVIRSSRLLVHESLLGGFVGGDGVVEGWYDTGDLAEIVSESPLQFRLTARERVWINVGGAKVDPHEVEAVLEEIPAVKKALVYGRRNSVLGQIVCAEILAQSPGLVPSEGELRGFVESRLAPHKVPRFIKMVDQLSQTRTGKLLRP